MWKLYMGLGLNILISFCQQIWELIISQPMHFLKRKLNFCSPVRLFYISFCFHYKQEMGFRSPHHQIFDLYNHWEKGHTPQKISSNDASYTFSSHPWSASQISSKKDDTTHYLQITSSSFLETEHLLPIWTIISYNTKYIPNEA